VTFDIPSSMDKISFEITLIPATSTEENGEEVHNSILLAMVGNTVS